MPLSVCESVCVCVCDTQEQMIAQGKRKDGSELRFVGFKRTSNDARASQSNALTSAGEAELVP